MEKMHRMSKLIAVVLALAALVLLLLWMQGVLGGGKIRPGEVAMEQPGVGEPYQVDAAKRTTFPNREEVVGTVVSKREVIIVPRIMGAVLELAVKAGDQVVQGQVLARLDDRDVRARLEQARSGVVEAESEFGRAASDYERFQRLRREEAVPQQRFEQAEAQYRTASARVKISREAGREAEINLGYTVIRSPVDGFVVEKNMEVGDMAAPGRPLLVVQEGGSLLLEAAVREGLAGSVNFGDRLTVRIDAVNAETMGTVDQKGPAADPKSRSFQIKLSLPQQHGLRSGMFGRVYIPTGSVTPLTVPRGAIRRVGQLETVTVLEEGRSPQRRYVRTGRIYDDRIEVFSGLEEGEKVLVFAGRGGAGEG